MLDFEKLTEAMEAMEGYLENIDGHVRRLADTMERREAWQSNPEELAALGLGVEKALQAARKQRRPRKKTPARKARR